MTERRNLVHLAALFAAPAIVAWFGWSVPAALLLIALLLLWRWLIVMSGLARPEKSADLVLETIAISHFAEKVRWCLDRLGIDYTEKVVAGTLGAFYRGRTVPQLKARTGAVRSTIGNSREILRYVWGRYGYQDPAAAEFLETNNERTELEARLDRFGRSLQVWIYHRLLRHRELCLRLWGVDDPAIPMWQRQLIRWLYPMQARLIRNAFRIEDESFAREVAKIEELLVEMNGRLTTGARSLLGGDEPNYTDFAFAAMCGVWLMPAGYGGGRAEAVRLEREQLPPSMLMDVESWEAAYPEVVDFVTRLYAAER